MCSPNIHTTHSRTHTHSEEQPVLISPRQQRAVTQDEQALSKSTGHFRTGKNTQICCKIFHQVFVTFSKISPQTERACEVESESLLSKYVTSCCVYCIIMRRVKKKKTTESRIAIMSFWARQKCGLSRTVQKDPSIRTTELTSLGLSR